MEKREIQYWFNKGADIGYHAAINDKKLIWMKPLKALFDKLFLIRYPKNNCDHKWYENSNGGAVCILCDARPTTFTWYCRESEDHLCHYTSGNYDQCDFCGNPQERK